MDERNCILPTAAIILISLASIITAVIICSNGFILWKLNPFGRVNRTRKVRANFDILLSYLSAVDFLAAISMIIKIYQECNCYRGWPFGTIGCKIILPFYDISVNVSICILIIISIERHRSITMPLKKIHTPRMIHISVLISVIISTSAYFQRFMITDVRDGICYYYTDATLLNLSPLFVWTIRDFAFLAIFTTTSVLIQRFLTSQNITLKSYRKRKREQSKRMLRMFIVMQSMFSVLVLPYDILSSISLGYAMVHKANINGSNQTFKLISNYLYLLQMSHSIANCFLYAKIHRLATAPVEGSKRRSRTSTKRESLRVASPSIIHTPEKVLAKQSPTSKPSEEDDKLLVVGECHGNETCI